VGKGSGTEREDAMPSMLCSLQVQTCHLIALPCLLISPTTFAIAGGADVCVIHSSAAKSLIYVQDHRCLLCSASNLNYVRDTQNPSGAGGMVFYQDRVHYGLATLMTPSDNSDSLR
jgi:hypothetical protein